MKIILSTNGYEILVDDWNYNRLSQHNWYITQKGNGYAQKTTHDEPRLMNHVVLNVTPQILKEKGSEIDHIDRNKLNNQENNLRIATISQNRFNRKHGEVQRYRGVSCVSGRWQAAIQLHGKKIYLGRYDSREEAAIAYNQKAVELFGEFAVLNETSVNT